MIGPDDVGRQVVVTLHRGLGELRGTLEGVGRVEPDGRIVDLALVTLEDGSPLETSTATLAIAAAGAKGERSSR